MNAKLPLLRCFDIGGSKIVAADVSAHGRITGIVRDVTPRSDFSKFCSALNALSPADGTAISISIAGVIHQDTGVITCANIPCLSGRALATDLQKALGRRVTLINDADAFALAQSVYGGAQSHPVVLAIILGTGIGGGVVIDGRVLKSPDGGTGEWGHGPASTVRTGYSLPAVLCNCGQHNCVDVFGGARGLERLHQQITSTHASSIEILKAWQAGDSLAGQTVDVWLDIVGGALASVVNLLGPSVVPVGGGLAGNDSLISALDREVNSRRLVSRASPLLYAAVSGPEQGLLGAAVHARGS